MQCNNQPHTLSAFEREYVFTVWDDWDLNKWFYGLEDPGLETVFDRNMSQQEFEKTIEMVVDEQIFFA